MRSRWCHLCHKTLDLVGNGAYRQHLTRDSEDACPMSGKKPLIAPPLSWPGYYWVRRTDAREWSVSLWDGGRWTNVGHEAEWLPGELDIAEWRGPIEPPR